MQSHLDSEPDGQRKFLPRGYTREQCMKQPPTLGCRPPQGAGAWRRLVARALRRLAAVLRRPVAIPAAVQGAARPAPARPAPLGASREPSGPAPPTGAPPQAAGPSRPPPPPPQRRRLPASAEPRAPPVRTIIAGTLGRMQPRSPAIIARLTSARSTTTRRACTAAPMASSQRRRQKHSASTCSAWAALPSSAISASSRALPVRSSRPRSSSIHGVTLACPFAVLLKNAPASAEAAAFGFVLAAFTPPLPSTLAGWTMSLLAHDICQTQPTRGQKQ